jgi:hypothetical protein
MSAGSRWSALDDWSFDMMLLSYSEVRNSSCEVGDAGMRLGRRR